MFQLPEPDTGDLEDPVRLRALKARLFGDSEPALRVGRYALDRMLGQGAMGVVYLARDERLDRPVAIKLLRPGAATGAARLEREAKALASLSHPNVVTIHEVGEHDEQTFIAMEYVRGQSLRQWMETPRPLPERIDVLRQAALGLRAAHAIGLVHRDFKPHNAIVGDDGRLRIVDFGLATLPTGHDAGTGVSSPIGFSAVTETGACLGTPAYMAPELFRGGAPSPASDQFALGCVGWELLLGRHPFADRERDDPPQMPSDPRLPVALARAITRCLAADPTARHIDLDALVDACARGTPKRRPLLPIAAAVAGTGMAALLWFAQPQPQPTDPPPSALTECTQTLADDASRHSLHSNLALAQEERDAQIPGTLPHTRAEIRVATAQLGLGEWEEGCTRLVAIGDALPDAACWHARYCEHEASLPPRARCFGGDLEQCNKATIRHQYEYLDSRKSAADDPAARAAAQLHLGFWGELADAACELGDEEACRQLTRPPFSPPEL